MILISLLIVISLERLFSKSQKWHAAWYTQQYRQWCSDSGLLKADAPALQTWLVLLLPALLLAAIEAWLLGPFLVFIEQTLILFICIGCPALRDTYKCFLKAADRGDLAACSLYTQQLGFAPDNEEQTMAAADAAGKSFGQHMTWLNYQHYAAVMLWFIGFGAPGAVFYVLVRDTYTATAAAGHPQTNTVYRLLFALDFIPVRITSAGLLMMGHFSRALPEWLKLSGQIATSPYRLLTNIASKAEMLTPQEQQAHEQDASVEPKVLVKLAKRNTLFLLVVTALLTLSGALL
ncbi:beta-lactamase regulator AmpE [Alteromonas halophila]|uniref:Beta-lactamase regulator AmpE n=1 Tax=Alteromonas halophila TaxID=516698 RepID=A0A918JS68_9ALTE|nr:beta-lactamase regulator AmpE [Alteromonas halophila]GGW93998.1 hypothetical protein GCM10007391_30380 [Alteromonas halophila]